MSFLTKIFGDPGKKAIKEYQVIVDRVNAFESSISSLSDEDLTQKTKEFRQRLSEGASLQDLLPEAFATVREAAKRTLNQRHFDVQIMGALALHEGAIAEMKTGEGKTLTSTLAVYLNGLSGKGVHVVTVNDYLAKRDADWMGRIYHRLGLTVGCVQHEASFLFDPKIEAEKADEEASFKVDMENLKPVGRKMAYHADITYGTNNEFGFDYLRDHMVQDLSQKVQRELNYAIVDEVDSILIDEARTPLIISAPDEEATDKYLQMYNLVAQLKEKADYNVDEKMKATTMTDEGIRKMEKWLGVENIYEERGMRDVHLIEQTLKAHALFKRDRDYVIKDGEIIIVDEFTGRLMFGRRYSEGLHQAIEAKEGVEIKQESRTLATITFQNYFRLYKKLAGMTGTASTEAEEFLKIYGLAVIPIPTHRAMIRQDRPDIVYKTEEAKFNAVVHRIKELHDKRQPVLVGTISIERNEVLGQMLLREGIPYHLLNAKNHEQEAEIIAQAGKADAVTIATNMAGRGVDIILGGNPSDPSNTKVVQEAGGLAVIGTERHEARRIDNQLRGRSGRQGDAGTSQFFVSLEDDLMRIFGSDKMKKLMTTMGLPDDVPIENALFSRAIESAQKKVEGLHFDSRKHVVEYDDVMNKHREVIYKKRDEILNVAKERPAELKHIVLEMIEHEIEHVVSFHTAVENGGEWNIKEILETAKTMFPLSSEAENTIAGMRGSHEKKGSAEGRSTIIDILKKEGGKAYEAMERTIGDSETLHRLERMILLRAMDSLWVDHLDQMTALREGIGLRGYAQQDPLVEYKREAYQLFVELNDEIQREVVYSIFKIGAAQTIAPSVMERTTTTSAPQKTMTGGDSAIRRIASELASSSSESGPKRQGLTAQPSAPLPPGMMTFQEPPKDDRGQRIGRNDPCFCGSGKKFKKCHGA